MKLDLKAKEHVRISHDGKLGFMVWIEQGILHVRAKEELDCDCGNTTVVIHSGVQVQSGGAGGVA